MREAPPVSPARTTFRASPALTCATCRGAWPLCAAPFIGPVPWRDHGVVLPDAPREMEGALVLINALLVEAEDASGVGDHQVQPELTSGEAWQPGCGVRGHRHVYSSAPVYPHAATLTGKYPKVGSVGGL